MSRNINFSIACFALAQAALAFAGAPVSAAELSTFQRSCSRIGIEGTILFANCKRADGSINQTELELIGIENINGQLTYTDPGRRSSFQRTCVQTGIEKDLLFSLCRRADGSEAYTYLRLLDIENIDGELQYR